MSNQSLGIEADKAYCERRASEEIDLVRKSQHPKQREVHLCLAEIYAERAREHNKLIYGEIGQS